MKKYKKDNSPSDNIIKKISKIWRKDDTEYSTDILGSYTGNPEDLTDSKPEQDADDL